MIVQEKLVVYSERGCSNRRQKEQKNERTDLDRG